MFSELDIKEDELFWAQTVGFQKLKEVPLILLQWQCNAMDPRRLLNKRVIANLSYVFSVSVEGNNHLGQFHRDTIMHYCVTVKFETNKNVNGVWWD